MIKFFSNLFGRSTQVKTETTNLANTALRVGGLLEDLSKAVPMKWDPDGIYDAGQVVYFNDLRYEAVSPTQAGQSPATHAAKWSKKAVTDKAQLTLGNNLLVTAGAVRAAIDEIESDGGDVPNATETVFGKVRKSTKPEVNEGVVDDAFVTPLDLKSQIAAIVLGNLTTTLKKLLANTADGGNVGEDYLILKDTAGKPVNITLRRGPTPFIKGIGVENEDGSRVGSFGIDTNDHFIAAIKDVTRLEVSEAELVANIPRLLAGSAQATFQGMGTVILQAASNYQSVYVPEYDPLTGRNVLKAVTLSDFWVKLFATTDKSQLAAVFAPYYNGVTVAGDDRVIQAIFCYEEAEQYNEEYIAITYSMLGTPQAHHLLTPGSQIYRTLQRIGSDNDDRSDATPYIKITFPTASTYVLTPQDSDLATGFTGELYLRKKVPAEEIYESATRYVLQFARLASELSASSGTGQNPEKALYLLPSGFAPPAVGSLAHPIGQGWERYPGYQSALGTECGGVTPPITGAPVWDELTPPPITPGGEYYWQIPDDAVTPGAVGSFITLSLTSAHPWLNVTGYIVYGNAPSNLTTSVPLGLTATQSVDGKSANTVVTIPLVGVTASIYILWRQYVNNGTRLLVMRGGGNFGDNLPYLTLTGPTGWSGNALGKFQMKKWGIKSAGVDYYYDIPGFTNAPAGTYLFTYETISGTRYGRFVLGLNDEGDKTISLESTPPVVAPEPIQVQFVDWQWNRGTPNTLSLLIKTNGGVGGLEYALEAVAPGGYSFAKTAYSGFATGVYGNGYTLFAQKTGLVVDPTLGLALNVYIRRLGESADLVVIYQPGYSNIPGSGDINRTTIYPTTSGGGGPTPPVVTDPNDQSGEELVAIYEA